uniref:Cystatin-A-like n=1 Tax=Xenopus tropicalis TaxID=8364 RepID=A0A6I8QDP0_XENTR
MSRPLAGGMSAPREPTPDDQKIADQVQAEVKAKTNQKIETFEVVEVATQVVAGTNYFMKVKVGSTDYIHIRVYQDLSGTVSLSDVKDCQTKDSPLVYF